MGQRDFFRLGDHNAICYVCGFKRKASEMKLRWDGVYVCKEDWEVRQPQDFVRGIVEEVQPPWTQSETPDTFVGAAPAPLTNIVVGTPSIYLNGVLQTNPANYTIVLPQGVITFVVAPPAGQIIAWTGVWLDNASVQTPFTLFPLYTADGFSIKYAIYGTA